MVPKGAMMPEGVMVPQTGKKMCDRKSHANCPYARTFARTVQDSFRTHIARAEVR